MDAVNVLTVGLNNCWVMDLNSLKVAISTSVFRGTGAAVSWGAQLIREGSCPPGPIAGYGPGKFAGQRPTFYH